MGGEWLRFEDPKLEMYVREEIGVPAGPIGAAMVGEVRSIIIKGLASLRGAECLSELNYVQSNYGMISDLSPLEFLDVSDVLLGGNAIRDISPLAGKSLSYISLSDNHIEDISPIFAGGITSPFQANFERNPIQTLDGIVLEAPRDSATFCYRIHFGDVPTLADETATLRAWCELGWDIDWKSAGASDVGEVSCFLDSCLKQELSRSFLGCIDCE